MTGDRLGSAEANVSLVRASLGPMRLTEEARMRVESSVTTISWIPGARP
jgi:hypothetical protein